MKTLLLILLIIIAVTSTVSGILMISDPEGQILKLSPELLEGTPFKSFLLPGILLASIVGSVNIVAVIFNIRHYADRYDWSMAGGALIVGWVAVQIIFIHTAHWLHFIYLCIGILIILIAYQLKGKWAV